MVTQIFFTILGFLYLFLLLALLVFPARKLRKNRVNSKEVLIAVIGYIIFHNVYLNFNLDVPLYLELVIYFFVMAAILTVAFKYNVKHAAIASLIFNAGRIAVLFLMGLMQTVNA